VKEEEKDTMEIFSVKAFLRQIQILCFLDGLELAGTKENDFSEEEGTLFLKFLRTKIDEIGATRFGSSKEQVTLRESLANEIEHFWERHYLSFASICRQIRVKKIERRQFLLDHKWVGRNDPCPCGSGKKFKKCCLN
jgi:uncharacterized protein YecA (UPF0149 family)